MKTILSALALSLALALPASAPAVVPSKSCGFKTVKGKRYNIRVDGVTCRWGKPRAVEYLRTGRKPSGWTCRNYRASQTSLKFKCDRGRKSFFAIRR